MTKNLPLITTILILFSTLAARSANCQSIHLTIAGIRSANGQIIVNIFKDNSTYNNEKPYNKLPFEKKGITDGKLELTFKIEPGTYGLTIVDDENKNGFLDKNFIGFPREGFGFSNFFMTKKSKPSFDDFKIQIERNDEKRVMIKVKYM